MAQADVVVLCLPDAAAVEAVALAASLGDRAPRIVDASTAHRVADGWVYGFAELDSAQAEAIKSATHVANPGCYPTGAIALIRPLVDAGLLPADAGVTVNAVSGYSGGGKPMIESYEVAKTAPSFELYGLALAHKHVPELQRYSGLTRRPIFVPSVGNFRQGMLVERSAAPRSAAGQAVAARCAGGARTALQRLRARCTLCRQPRPPKLGGRLDALALNGSDKLELYVFPQEEHGQVLLVARLDNLGKGAAGAAVQNIRLMLGL